MSDVMDHVLLRPLVEKVAAARRMAYATCPRDNNDHLEASMFVAMAHVLNEHYVALVAPVEEPPPPPPDEEGDVAPEPVALEPVKMVTEGEGESQSPPDLPPYHAAEQQGMDDKPQLPEVNYEHSG